MRKSPSVLYGSMQTFWAKGIWELTEITVPNSLRRDACYNPNRNTGASVTTNLENTYILPCVNEPFESTQSFQKRIIEEQVSTSNENSCMICELFLNSWLLEALAGRPPTLPRNYSGHGTLHARTSRTAPQVADSESEVDPMVPTGTQ